MKLFSLTLAGLALAVACSTPQSSEATEDSIAFVSEDTLALDDAVINDEMAPVDTIFHEVQFDKTFDQPQFARKIAYVYNEIGLDVYSKLDENGSPLEQAGHLDHKQQIRLTDDLVNNGPAHGSEMDGLFGHYVAFDFEGKTGYVFSGYLLNLPVPETDDVIQYFSNTLQIIKPVIERKSRADAEDGTFLLAKYDFENGFKIFRHEYYEGGGTEVTLSGFTAQEAFLFASQFYESFPKHLEQFPTQELDKDLPEETHVTVHVNQNGDVESIVIGAGEGCYWQDSIAKTDTGMIMISEGGC